MCVCVFVSYNEIRLALGLMKPVVIYQHYVRLHPPALFIKLLTHTPQRQKESVFEMVVMEGVWWHFCFLSFFFIEHFFFSRLSSPCGLSSQMWCVGSNTFPLSVCLSHLTPLLLLTASQTAFHCYSRNFFSLFLVHLIPLSFLSVFLWCLFCPLHFFLIAQRHISLW